MASNSFNHVVNVESIRELSETIQRRGINLAHAPIHIPPAAQTYINNLDLSEGGDFKDIKSPKHDPSIGPFKGLLYYEVAADEDLNPDIILSEMTRMPDRAGKDTFASAVLCESLTTFWSMRENQSPNKRAAGSLLLKYPTARPKIHMDDDIDLRALIALRGDQEHGGMHYIENNAAGRWQRQESGHPFKNPIGVPGKDFEIEDHQMQAVPMNHMSVHRGIVYKTAPGLYYREDIQKNGVLTPLFERREPDTMYPQNPLAHTEPNSEQCPEPRLIWVMSTFDA